MTSAMIQVWATSEPESVLGAVRGIENALSAGSLEAWLSGEANSYIARRAADRFTKEGDDVVGQWQQLAPATVDIRQSQGFGGAHPINKRTGELEAFITQSDGRMSLTGTGVELVTPGDAPDGELALKLSMAQSGGTSKWGNPVPKRPVLGINTTDAMTLTELLGVHLEAQLRSGGLAGAL